MKTELDQRQNTLVTEEKKSGQNSARLSKEQDEWKTSSDKRKADLEAEL